jgi:hypothetical protein
MPPATAVPQPSSFELLYITPPTNSSAHAYAAYLLEHLRFNRPCLGHPALFHPHGFHVRNVGRTSLCGLSLLEQARRQPGEWVAYRDHFHGDSRAAQQIMRDTLQAILLALPWYESLGVELTPTALRVARAKGVREKLTQFRLTLPPSKEAELLTLLDLYEPVAAAPVS